MPRGVTSTAGASHRPSHVTLFTSYLLPLLRIRTCPEVLGWWLSGCPPPHGKPWSRGFAAVPRPPARPDRPRQRHSECVCRVTQGPPGPPPTQPRERRIHRTPGAAARCSVGTADDRPSVHGPDGRAPDPSLASGLEPGPLAPSPRPPAASCLELLCPQDPRDFSVTPGKLSHPQTRPQHPCFFTASPLHVLG